MAQPKPRTILAFIALTLMAPMAAMAKPESSLPILHLLKRQAAHDETPSSYVLTGALISGNTGAVSLYYQDPQIAEDGPFVGLASVEPDEVITDFSTPTPLEFQTNQMWVIFHPAPKSKMTFVIDRYGQGSATRVGTIQVKKNSKDIAYFRKVTWKAHRVRCNQSEMAEQILSKGSNALKAVTWAFRR